MITVIVPIYNNATFLPSLIQQFYQQTTKDFEVVFVDDGSTDNPRAAIQQIDRHELTYQYIYQHNQGVGSARNTGMNHARGRYLMFVDPDDQIMSNFVAEGLKTIQGFDLGIMAFDLINANGNQLISHYQWKSIDYTYADFLKNFSNLYNSELLFSVFNKVYDASILKKNRLKFSKLRMGEDFLFNMQYFDLIDSISLTDVVTYRYMIYGEGTATTSFHGDEFDCSYSNQQYLIDFLNRHHVYDEKLVSLHWSLILAYRFAGVRKLKKIGSSDYQFARSQFLEILSIFKKEKLVKVPLLPPERMVKYLVMITKLNRMFI
ncbi:glycosyltransferase family A protein [Fructobacillus evanidus]|uniref:GT2 family (WcaE) n=1 Tax=Fructobacillus evanidus TaxID=3064281 RepID=A0ABM9ML60_9LACO|nr:GT2 family (WcaE) [Fructobacillus sp. LMG 32999]CAK1223591.1 GT2 family (WcaE) [Fructobacillus sp. LMG 32999]CAK1223671.1 GT2 family (WcaE) [Fructobacillus sp. LMG 32999]CAK1231024.1 GT2 family (WcaE) [Fructobacillus sp. LMG 32999]CAK1250853.1 GT2 family (WcaE) [Fructobacillus sp. LMG 32999]